MSPSPSKGFRCGSLNLALQQTQTSQQANGCQAMKNDNRAVNEEHHGHEKKHPQSPKAFATGRLNALGRVAYSMRRVDGLLHEFTPCWTRQAQQEPWASPIKHSRSHCLACRYQSWQAVIGELVGGSTAPATLQGKVTERAEKAATTLCLFLAGSPRACGAARKTRLSGPPRTRTHALHRTKRTCNAYSRYARA